MKSENSSHLIGNLSEIPDMVIFQSPGGGGREVIFGLMSGGKGGFTSWFGDKYGGMLLPGVIGGVGLPGTGE